MTTRHTLAFVIALLLVASLGSIASAQVPGPVVLPNTVDIIVIAATGNKDTLPSLGRRNTPISATVNCNLAAPPAPPLPLINPMFAWVIDPFNTATARYCRVPMPIGLADALQLRAVAEFSFPDGTNSPRSLVGDPFFNIAGIPAPVVVPTGLVVRP